jgi:hypothetical protein
VALAIFTAAQLGRRNPAPPPAQLHAER